MSQATAQKRDDAQTEATMQWSHGRFCWNELLTHDPERAQELLRQDHRLELRADADARRRHLLGGESGRQAGGRHLRAEGSGLRGSARELDALSRRRRRGRRVKKALKAGATLMRPIFDIPGIGRIAILREPGGAGIGWMTPAW